MKKERGFNTARHHRQTQGRLIIGGGLVWLIYGGSAAVTAVACLFVAFGLFGLLWVILSLMELWVREDDG